MWSDMLGLGSFFRILSDPSLVDQVHAMMGAVIEAAQANKRIEAKLDELLAERRLTAIPQHYGPSGAGAYPAAGRALDHGDSGDASSAADADEKSDP
jgi:hypothetical protein